MWFSFFGKTIVYLKDRIPKNIMETCKRLEVTHIFNVPLFWNNVAQGIIRKVKQGGEKQEKLFNRMSKLSHSLQSNMKRAGRKMVGGSIFKGVQGNLVGGSIRFMINGGGHILPETMRTINNVGYPLYNGFGMTETGITSVELSASINKRLESSVGKPFKSIEYKVIPLGEDKNVGELLIRGDSLHSGRMIDGEYVPRDLSDGGWFGTGDIARLDDAGRLFIEGRLKEVIINESGENVYPDELEDYFAEMPGVDKFTVAGINTGKPYEEIMLVLRLTGDADEETVAQLADTISQINGALPMYKKVQKVLVSLDELPVANGIKVQRQKLKKFIEDGQWRTQTLNLTLQRLEGDAGQPSPVAAAAAGGAAQEDKRFKEIKEEVRKVFADVLILNESQIGDFDHFVTDLGGDSLSVVGVIAQLEEKYSIFISDEEFAGAVNVQQIAELLYNKFYGTGEAPTAGAKAAPAAAEKKTERIYDFKDTMEYKALQARFEQSLANGGEECNPYFVPHDSVIRDTSMVNGQEVINLGSYNYAGMSGHPETVAAAIEAVQKYGTSASGSRTLAGEKTLYQELEATIAKWKHTEDAIVLTGGHATNQTFVGNFCGEGDLILYDTLSHNSIAQGIQLSRAESKAFPHNDVAALETMLKNIEGKYKKVLIVIEGVYSMDGDIAPVPEFVRLKKQYHAFLMVDEAHSSGVIGPHGGGVDDYFGLAPDDIDIKMGTLSKAIGTCGGYIAANKDIITYLKYSLPGFVFSAGISPPLAAAAKRAVELFMEDTSAVENLHQNIAHFVAGAKARGMDTCLAGESAVVPIMIGRDDLAFRISYELLQKGVFVPPAVYPAVARGQSRLRFSLSSTHSKEQLTKALDALEEVLGGYGLLEK
ncbi:MAG: aminotransferase class I/II-fold pyridoxal phosphate-dependent enzyme, partial [Christensenellaceae bacterium]|nr:aminotransferase class I/II-fold pyridoxal phosphate-dependent enzyme [Christensenellaceae bacterium]